jgi:HSP20 family molecular chaperone IbpA
VFREPYSQMRWGFHREAAWRPPTDVYETGDRAIVMVEIAGLREGDYEVTLAGRVLIVAGERTDPAQKLAYQQMEIRWGRFRTDVYLPWPVDSTTIEVHYTNGLVQVTLRKAQPRHIPIRVGQEPAAGREAGGDAATETDGDAAPGARADDPSGAVPDTTAQAVVDERGL